MIKCIAVDDNVTALKVLEEHIANIPFLELLKTFENPFDAIDFLSREQVDLMFTEVDMPVLNGIQLINSLVKQPILVIISNSDKYAIDAFQLNVLDYILKPFSFDRLVRAANKVREYYNMKPAPVKVHVKIADDMYDYIFVKSDYKIIRIGFEDILLIEGLKDYVKIHTLEKSVLSLLSLKGLETRLPASRFMRVHRSYIVALNKIDSIEKSRIKIEKYYIPISDSYKEVFFKRIESQNL
ncbi:MAG: LytTR family DNA-binding domain-containing protein [Prevotellaceae bacterium]|jgi:DNA-binding LytR/AlgR family response regulator|nr:LytTR family DNA-binding domain-containing protein [Prevotellaceae bacterium]